MFSELLQDSAYGFHMWLASIFGVDQDVIQIHHNEDIKLFSKDLIDVALEASWCVRKAEKYYLVLEVAISSAESRLPLVTFPDSHPMVGTC